MSDEKEIYRLAAMGDVMLSRDVGRHFVDKPQDFLFDDIRGVLKDHDLIFLNLENPVGTKGTPHRIQDPQVTFCCHPDSLQVLKNLGVTAVSLGNNHMLDYGDIALRETVEHLDALGIKHAGAGRNYEEANRPLLMECKGRKIAFLSYVFIYSASTRMATRNKPGVSDHRIDRILPVIKNLSLSGYLAIVSIHWGHEYSFFPLPYQMRQARRMIDNGASIILGHGPHYPQGIENYNGGQIVYSLGNFIFDEPYVFANRSFIYSVEVTKKNTPQKKRIYPVHLNNHVATLVYGAEKERLENLVRILSDLYPRKSKTFWKTVNNDYFSDIVHRVFRMKSLKFISLPPMSFYFGIGFKNLIKKIKIKNILFIGKYPLKGILTLCRLVIPVGQRKDFVVWLNKQGWHYGTNSIIRDLAVTSPKAFHKFIWANHLRSYAKWYDSETLFDEHKMNGSTVTNDIFFNDLSDVIEKLGLDPSEDIRSVLEVGCSLGHVLRFIEKNIFTRAEKLVGVDIDREAINKGTAYLESVRSKVHLICGDMEKLDRLVGNDRFDLIFAAGVLSYLDARDAAALVSDMYRRTNRILALVGLACTSADNRELSTSRLSLEKHNQWIHNFEAMVEEAGGRVVRRRWEGAKVHDQALYFVFATKPDLYKPES